MRVFLMVVWAGAMVSVLFFGMGIGAVELLVLTVLWIARLVLLLRWAIPRDRTDTFKRVENA
jgi:hypothetical protein